MMFLAANGVPAHKYHETLTKSWLKAVKHFPLFDSHSEFLHMLGREHRLVAMDT